MTPIPVNIDRIVEAWGLVLAGARLEPNSSAPKMHRAVETPEIRDPILTYTLRHALNPWASMDRPVEPLNNVFETIGGEIFAYWQFQTREMQDFVSMQTLVERLDGWPVRFFLRLGLEHWLDRMIRRTLMMMKLRLCENPACQPRGYWHRHGDRDYYVNTLESRSPNVRRNSLQKRSRVGRSLPLSMNRNWD